jgi:hypothetical protein
MSSSDTGATGRPDDEAEPGLAGSAGADVSAGTSVSGLGGEALKTDDGTTGLDPVDERATDVGWGRHAAQTGMEPPAANDGTGQSEKPRD